LKADSKYCLVLLIALLSASLMTSGCQRANGNRVTTPAKPCPFDHSYASLDDLGRTAVKALNEGDTLGLWNLSVTEAEFRDVIWPRTPDHMGMEWTWAWRQNLMDAYTAIDRATDRYGKRNLSYVGVQLADTVVVVYPEKKTYHSVLTIAQMPDGDVIKFRFMNVVQEVDGWYKVVAFHD
jgi:hypothetical protein